MKKKGMMILLAVTLLLQSQTIFAFDTQSYQSVSGQAVDVELLGFVESPIISVVMPTQIKFAVISDAEGWNKILSPDFMVHNVGNVMLDVSITKADVKTNGVELTTQSPVYDGSVRQVRLAVAPKSDYPNATKARGYFLTNTVTDTSPIVLTNKLDCADNNNTATYNVYGDISSGWSNGDEFSVSAVFKVAIS